MGAKSEFSRTNCQSIDCAFRYEVFLIDEAVGSRDERHKNLAFDRLVKYGISLINFEMLVFEHHYLPQ